jgi:hypothetical protein
VITFFYIHPYSSIHSDLLLKAIVENVATLVMSVSECSYFHYVDAIC